MSVTLTVWVAVITVLTALFIQWKRKYSKMPPGPRPLPIIGNYLQIGVSTMAVDVTEIGKKYGDIFTVHFLMTPMLILNSYKVIKELLGSPEYAETFSGRVSDYFSKYLVPDDMVFQTVTDGQQYMRRLVMRGVKQYGTALKRVELIAQEELGILVKNTQDTNGLAFDPMPQIIQYTSNIIMLMVCGERFDPGHKMMRMVNEVVTDIDYLFNYKRQVLMNVVPFATMVPSELRKACNRLIENNQYFTDSIAEMRKEGINKHPECLFALLEEEYKHGNLTMKNVKGIILDQIVGGVITTAPTLYSALLALAHFPDVQKKIQEEIQRVVGTDRLPGLDDKPKLPYSHATMLEIFRYFCPITLPGPRSTIRDCSYREFFIPKDTMTTYNVWQVHHDEEFWKEPYKFDPTRFLDCDGNLVPPEDERRQRLMTFGVGKRSCVGEVLARVRIFLAMTAILQTFDLVEDPSSRLPSPDPRTYQVTFITVPPTYKVRFVSRMNNT